jgi:hypothetical protein
LGKHCIGVNRLSGQASVRGNSGNSLGFDYVAIQLPQKTHCGVGTACRGCGRRLPLRMAEDHEEAALWECVQCQTPLAGVLSPDVLRLLSRRIRLAALHFNIENAEPLTEAVLHVAWQNAFATQSEIVHETRRSRRVSGHREVVCVCMDERYSLAGSALNGVVANLSRHGLMLVTTRQITTPIVITQFQNARRTIQLIGRVVWNNYLDIGCFGAGVDFQARFGTTVH